MNVVIVWILINYDFLGVSSGKGKSESGVRGRILLKSDYNIFRNAHETN